MMFGWNEGGAIANNYGRAGHFSDHMITEMKKVVALMIGGLPDLDHLDRVPITQVTSPICAGLRFWVSRHHPEHSR